MRYLFILALTQSCLGMDIPTFISTMPGEPGKLALRTVRFQLPSEITRVHTVTYGNSQVGFFRLNQFLFQSPSIEFEIIPPGYREKTQFLVTASTRDGKRRVFKKTRRFHSPFPLVFREGEGTLNHGKFSAPFFFLKLRAGAPLSQLSNESNSHEIPLQPQHYRMTALVNRCGELVYTLPAHRTGSLTFTHLDNSGLFRSISHGELVTFDLKTTRLARTPISHQARFHHDLIVENNSLIALTSTNRMTEWGLFSGAFVLVTELVDRIARVDLDSGQLVVLWDASQAFSPWQYVASGRWRSLRPTTPRELTHLNSITPMRNGNYLASSAHLSRLLIFNPPLTKVVATIGNTPHDTFQTPDNDPFHSQHHATQLPSGNILLFDNGTPARPHSRVIELALAGKKASVVKSWSSNVYAPSRGSVYAVGDRLIAFFVDDRNMAAHSTLIEYDYDTGKEWARMALPNGYNGVHYRATPVFSIGGAQWLARSKGFSAERHETGDD